MGDDLSLDAPSSVVTLIGIYVWVSVYVPDKVTSAVLSFDKTIGLGIAASSSVPLTKPRSESLFRRQSFSQQL